MTSLETKLREDTYQNVTATKQKEFIEDAKSFGLVNGVTTGSLEARRGLASFFPFTAGRSVDNQRYAGILEYVNRVNGLSSRIEGIFIKLDVTSRTQAVAMGIESGVLTTT